VTHVDGRRIDFRFVAIDEKRKEIGLGTHDVWSYIVKYPERWKAKFG